MNHKTAEYLGFSSCVKRVALSKQLILLSDEEHCYRNVASIKLIVDINQPVILGFVKLLSLVEKEDQSVLIGLLNLLTKVLDEAVSFCGRFARGPQSMT